ncbi:MAG: fumarylacetoacetate hydrolase family protein [Candidatus Omnitrophica bacterium]|nr:fumarylacetoacetate hydrolase family protein [Candidatus Omnitrophota bacterium]
MKIARVRYNKKEFWGIIKEAAVQILQEPPFERIRVSKRSVPLAKVKLLVPTLPTKVVLVGLNYRDHAAELSMAAPDEPIIFLKPPTTVIGPGEKIIYPPQVSRLDYEAELALVIKRRARNISPAQAARYILGYTCLNDVTARDLQKKDGQWTRAKSFNTFCPIGPWLETRLCPDDVRIRTVLNGDVKQDSSTAQFIFTVPHLVAYISSIMTLEPGDVISTGTPPGVGPMKTGDIVAVEIEGIGRLENTIK